MSTFYGVSLLFVVPYLFFFRDAVLPPRAPWRCFLTVLVIAHTLHALRHVLCKPISAVSFWAKRLR